MVNEKVKVSFIIPAYNVEEFIGECLDSIISQTLDSKEIIIINDGSTDRTLEIARSYEKKYSFITIIDKSNEGVSIARNVGILASKGEYICFIDGDDFYTIDFAEKLYNISKKEKLDIARGLYSIYDNSSIEEYMTPINYSINYYNKIISGFDFLRNSMVFKSNEVVPWLGFFRKEYLVKNGIYFPEGIAYEEDQIFFLKSLVCDKKCRVMQVELNFYAYRNRLGSVTSTSKIKHIQDIIDVITLEYNLFNNYYIPRNIKRYIYKYISCSFSHIVAIYSKLNNEDIYKAKQMISSIDRSIKFNILINSYSSKILIKTFLFFLVPSIFRVPKSILKKA